MYHQGVANSAKIYGQVRIGTETIISQGAILRSHNQSLSIGQHSGILENCVLVSTKKHPVSIGSKTVFGHSSLVLGGKIGNLCEVGNRSTFLPGADVGDRCIFGEGTLVLENQQIPSESVVVGRPGRIIRKLTNNDLEMIKRMRNNDIQLEDYIDRVIDQNYEEGLMGTLHPFKDKYPDIHASATIYESAEITEMCESVKTLL